MKARAIAGVVLCVIGLLWIVQGLNKVKGSGMTGHRQYAVLGAVVVVVGLALLLWAWTIRRSRQH
jgi:protein-S-isoprenylcysteine O-methyltransferase Ste14